MSKARVRKYVIFNIIFCQPFSSPDIDKQSEYINFFAYKNSGITYNIFQFISVTFFVILPERSYLN